MDTEGFGAGPADLLGSALPLIGAADPPRPARPPQQRRSFNTGNPAAARVLIARVAGRDERRFAAAVAAVMILLMLIATPFCGIPLRAVPGFVVVYSTALIILNLLTSVILLCRARIENDQNHLNLATAYLFAALILAVHLFTYPDSLVHGMILGVPGTTTWIWLFWHFGLPLLVIRYCLLARRRNITPPRPLRAVLIAVLLVAVSSYLAIYRVADLPVILQGLQYFPGLLGRSIEVTLFCVCVGAAVLVAVSFRLRSIESLWLAVSMIGISADVWLTSHGGHRYSLGWYCGRVGSLSSGFIIFTSLLNDVLLTYSKVAEANEALDKLTMTDALTELGNRRLFDKTLADEWRRNRRENTQLAVIIIDVDFFKSYNDAYGHQSGDHCLRQIAAQLAISVSRPGDMAARYGGEEFALILPATDSKGADHIARLIRLRIRDLAIAHSGNGRGFVTVSAGVASLVPSEAFEASELVRLADIALYRAKAAGRDAVVVAG